jgi:curved DNA-binding protein CbpA
VPKTASVPKRDPHDVLGVSPGASQATIKAAWRRLAREHHPDLATESPAAARAATRRMAEINRAYEQLRSDGGDRAAGLAGATRATNGRRPSWPPREKPTRPVTGRLDTSATFRPRNVTTGPRPTRSGPPPLRVDRLRREPLRASQPTGPAARGRQHNFRPPEPPSIEDALGRVIGFGKFHGHSLGEIAVFEPSYIDWLARTISRDPDLVAAARVIRADLEARSAPRPARSADG